MSLPLDAPGPDWIGIVQELGEIALQGADGSATLGRIARLARKALGSRACVLTRVDLTHGQFTTLACDGPDAIFVSGTQGDDARRALGGASDGAIGRGDVLERYDLTDALSDCLTDSLTDSLTGGLTDEGLANGSASRRAVQIRSMLGHPLTSSNGETIGYLSHFSSSDEPFSPSVRALLGLFARHAASAVARGEWHGTFGRSVAALNALSENLLSDPDQFLQQVARTACDLLDVPICVVWQRVEQEQKLRIVASAGAVDAAFLAIELDLDAPGIRQALATRAVKSILDLRLPHPMYGHAAEARERGWISLLCAPMFVADRLIGMLDVYTTRQRRFESREKELFGLFANNAALSIYTLGNRRRLEALNELMRTTTEARSIDEVLTLFLHGGLNLVGATRGWISRIDLRTGDLEIKLSCGDPPDLRTLKWGEGVTGRAVARGVMLNIGDVTAPEWQGVYQAFWPDTRSEVAIPIMVRNAEVREGTEVQRGSKPIGVLNVESARPNAFTQTSAGLLWSLAQHAAIVIEKLEFDERLSELERIERSIGQLATFDETVEAVAKAVMSPLGYDVVNVSLVRPESGRIRTERVLGIPEDRQDEFTRMADHPITGDDIQADIVRTGVAEVPSSTDPRFDQEIYKHFGHASLIRVFVPMRLPPGNRVIGTIEAGYNQTYRRFIYERDVNMLQGLADYAALALEHKNLGRLTLHVAAILKEGLAAVKSTQGSLLMLNKDSQRLEVIERQGRPYASGNVRLEEGKGVAGIAIRDRRPQRVDDISKHPDFIAPARGEPTFQSMLVVPLVNGDRAIGAICAHGEAIAQFDRADEDRLVEVTKGVAATIEQLGVDTFVGHTRRLKELEQFRGVAEELARLTRDLPKLREEIAKAAVLRLDATSAVLYEYHQESDSFEAPPAFSGDIREPDALRGATYENRAAYLVVQKGSSHYTETPRLDPIMSGPPRSAPPGTPVTRSFVERESLAAAAGILLRAGQEIVGVLFLNYRSPHPFAEYEKHVIGGFAADAALALQEARAVRDAVLEGHRSALQQNRSVMAHRLKSPLVSMKWQLAKIYAISTQPAVRDRTWRASELNRHVQNLVARFNASDKPLPFAQMTRTSGAALHALLTDALASNMTRDDTRTAVTVAADLPAIRIDSEALTDDVIGLLHDSERHCPSATCVEIDAGLARPSDLQRWNLPPATVFVKLAYRDNGPGVPPHLKERIFDESFSTAPDGTGLGLAIARDNAIRHGGIIRECGLFRHGVLFEMYLPADVTRQRHSGDGL